MALVVSDRVKETSTTTGTGTYTLAGAISGFETFSSIGDGNTTYYCCTLGSDFEVGIGTYTASGTTLARTTILQSSNSDSAVNWGSGTKIIFCTLPAEKAVFKDASGNITTTGDIDIDGTTNLDNTDIDGTLVVDGSNISLDSTSTLNIDNSNTSNGITIGTATSGVPISIGHTTSETTVNDNLTVTGDLTVSGTTTTVNSTTVNLNDHNIVLDSGNSTSAVINGAGITIEGGSGDDATFSYNTTGPKFELKLGSSHEDLQVDGLISGSMIVADGGNIGSTSDTDAIAIGADGDVTLTQDLELQHDGVTLSFGANDDVVLTHVHDTGLLLNSTMQFQFGDSGTYIHQSADGVLDLVSDTEIELNATTLDVNANQVNSSYIQFGNYLWQNADGSNIFFGANFEVQFLHIHNKGLRLSNSDSTNANTAHFILNNLDTSISTDQVLGSLEFQASAESDGSDAVLTAAFVRGVAEGAFTTSSNATKLSFGTGSSEAAAEKMSLSSGGNLTVSGTYTGGGLMTTGGNIVIPDAGNIGSASDTDAISIASTGQVSLTQDLTVKTSDGAILKLQTSDTSVEDGDVIGAIEFAAPDESDGTDAVATAASIVAEADATFATDNNKTDLVIKLGKSEAATERGRFKHEGGLTLTGYDTDANPDPSLELFRNTASPADNDFIGNIYFSGKNSADEDFVYVAFLAQTNDVTDGTEDGKIIIRVAENGNPAWSGSSSDLITLTPDTIAFDASSGTTFGGHDISSVGNITISDGGNIGSASDTDAISIASDGKTTFSQNIIASGNIELGNASDTTLARSSAGVVTIEGNTIATREQLKGDATNGAGVFSDEIIARKIHSGCIITRQDDSSQLMIAGRPMGGFFSQTTATGDRIFFMPIFIPGEGADDNFSVGSFQFQTGFSGTITNRVVKMGLYTLNKFGYPSQLVSKSSASSGTSTSTNITATPDVTSITPGRYALALAAVSGSTVVVSNFNSTSAGASFFQDGFSDLGVSGKPTGMSLDSALSSGELPTDLSSTSGYTDRATVPYMMITYGATYTGE